MGVNSNDMSSGMLKNTTLMHLTNLRSPRKKNLPEICIPRYITEKYLGRTEKMHMVCSFLPLQLDVESLPTNLRFDPYNNI